MNYNVHLIVCFIKPLLSLLPFVICSYGNNNWPLRIYKKTSDFIKRNVFKNNFTKMVYSPPNRSFQSPYPLPTKLMGSWQIWEEYSIKRLWWWVQTHRFDRGRKTNTCLNMWKCGEKLTYISKMTIYLWYVIFLFSTNKCDLQMSNILLKNKPTINILDYNHISLQIKMQILMV